MDYGECIVTDESRLSDFASCGLPEDIADATHSLTALYSAWDARVVPVGNGCKWVIKWRAARTVPPTRGPPCQHP
jgi:hypothetical protein